MFIRFAGGGTAVFYELCVIVRVVDVYHDLCVIVRVVDVYQIRFAERRTAVFHDLCVIVRVVDVYQICRERNVCVL